MLHIYLKYASYWLHIWSKYGYEGDLTTLGGVGGGAVVTRSWLWHWSAGGGPGASCVSDKLIILLLSPDPELSRAETSNFAVSESVKCVLARSCHIQLLILSRIRGCHTVILATQRIIRLHRASVVYREARKQLKGLVSVKCLTRKLCFQQAFNIFCRYLAAASWAPILPWQP